jgi:hypothetical protein
MYLRTHHGEVGNLCGGCDVRGGTLDCKDRHAQQPGREGRHAHVHDAMPTVPTAAGLLQTVMQILAAQLTGRSKVSMLSATSRVAGCALPVTHIIVPLAMTIGDAQRALQGHEARHRWWASPTLAPPHVHKACAPQMHGGSQLCSAPNRPVHTCRALLHWFFLGSSSGSSCQQPQPPRQ